MLGLFILYFLGKKFYELADEYDKNKWGFAILGVITYYGGAFVFGIVLGVLELLTETTWIETKSDLVLGLIAMPFGLLACYGLYYFLEKTWKKEIVLQKDTRIEQIGKSEE
jgi:hypothetical protein